MIINFV